MPMCNEMPNVAPNGWYTVSQTAKILNYSCQQIRRYIQQHKLKNTKVNANNNKREIKGSEIIRFWNNKI